MDQTLSFQQLSTLAHQVAAQLVSLGVTPGQTVASLLPNAVEAVFASYGIRLCGGAETPLSWGYTLEEIQWCAELAKFEYVLTTQAREKELQTLGFKTLSVESIQTTRSNNECSDSERSDSERNVFEQQDPYRIEKKDVLNGFPAVEASVAGRILFTSGTTGKPKGVRYTHGARWAGEQLLKATFPFIPEPGEKILLMTPFVHGASLLAYAWCDFGGTIVLHQGVDIDRITPLLVQGQLSAIFAPPTVLAKITAALDGQKFPSIRCVFTGTQPLTQAIYQRTKKMFGPNIRITYGKSECVNPITVLDRTACENYFSESNSFTGACVGWPAPGVEIKTVIQRETDEQPNGEIDETTDGEIFLRAPHMSSGLIDQNGFSAHAPDGWHQTGDLGHFDQQGRLILTGRVADVIKTGGYRVNPDEIEAILAHNQYAGQICVTSIASDYWGEIIIAVAENTSRQWVEQSESLLSNMSRYKQPRHFISVANLPRNAQGKISRRQVSQHILQTHQLIDGPYPKLIAINI